MASPLTLTDLPFGGIRPCEYGTAIPSLPFRINGDFSTVAITRTFIQRRDKFYPASIGVLRDCRSDTSDPGEVYYGDAYLISESDPQPAQVPTLVTFSRTFARVPPVLYDPLTRVFDRPNLNDIVSGSTYGVSFDEGKTSHLFSSRISVSSLGAITQPATSVAVAAEAFGTLPGTSFTIIDDGSHSASPNLSDGAATMQSALEGTLTSLTSVQVTSVPGALTISWVGTVSSIATAATGVTISGGAGKDGSVTFTANRPTVTDTQSPATATAIRVITTGSAHSGNAGEWMAAWNGSKLVGITKAVAASGSSVTVTCDESPWAVGSLAITHVAFAGQAAFRVVNGPVDCSARLKRNFYLPGVTAGIANQADVPTFDPQVDPVSWLAVLVAYIASPSEDTYAVEATQDLTRWLDGPILEKDVVEIQVKDAYKTVAVGA